MAVRIRLSRIGKKHKPFFRVVVVDSRKKRDGAILDNVGTYDAIKGQIIRFDENLYNEWMVKGALPTDSAKKIFRLYKKKGVTLQEPKERDNVVADEVKAPQKKAASKKDAAKDDVAKDEKKSAEKVVDKAAETEKNASESDADTSAAA